MIIEASLSYGRLLTKKQKIVAYLAIAISFLFPIVTLAILITQYCGVFTLEKENWIVLIFFNGFCFFSIFVVLLEIVNDKKIQRKILIWKQDAIETVAYAHKMNNESPDFKPYQTRFDFTINGQRLSRISVAGNVIKGYHKLFSKYDGKAVKIMYSPKYDQVLILKD